MANIVISDLQSINSKDNSDKCYISDVSMTDVKDIKGGVQEVSGSCGAGLCGKGACFACSGPAMQ